MGPLRPPTTMVSSSRMVPSYTTASTVVPNPRASFDLQDRADAGAADVDGHLLFEIALGGP